MAATEIILHASGSVPLAWTVKDRYTQTAVNLSACTTKNAIFEAPDGTQVTIALTFTTTGADGKVYCQPTNIQLTQVGQQWRVQLHFKAPTWEERTDPQQVTVRANL